MSYIVTARATESRSFRFRRRKTRRRRILKNILRAASEKLMIIEEISIWIGESVRLEKCKAVSRICFIVCIYWLFKVFVLIVSLEKFGYTNGWLRSFNTSFQYISLYYFLEATRVVCHFVTFCSLQFVLFDIIYFIWLINSILSRYLFGKDYGKIENSCTFASLMEAELQTLCNLFCRSYCLINAVFRATKWHIILSIRKDSTINILQERAKLWAILLY